MNAKEKRTTSQVSKEVELDLEPIVLNDKDRDSLINNLSESIAPNEDLKSLFKQFVTKRIIASCGGFLLI